MNSTMLMMTMTMPVTTHSYLHVTELPIAETTTKNKKRSASLLRLFVCLSTTNKQLIHKKQTVVCLKEKKNLKQCYNSVRFFLFASESLILNLFCLCVCVC